MEFNFGNMASESFDGSQSQYLKAYGIYKVKLTKMAIETINGVKDPNAKFSVVALEFTGTDENPGTFSTNIFFPQATQADLERPKFKNEQTGHEYERPSRFENFKYTLMQIVQVLNPDGANKIKENGSKIKTVEDFVKYIIKAVESKKNVVTNLKLVGRNNNGVVYATLPNACGINKEGKLFPINFIGENLFFSAYEETQKNKVSSAKPTPVKDDIISEEGSSLDDLLNEI